MPCLFQIGVGATPTQQYAAPLLPSKIEGLK